MDESKQYELIHHEFAGLANFERPQGDDSDYAISNQLSGFLVDEIVKKLAVKPQIVPPVDESQSPLYSTRELFRESKLPDDDQVVGKNWKCNMLYANITQSGELATNRVACMDIIKLGDYFQIKFGDDPMGHGCTKNYVYLGKVDSKTQSITGSKMDRFYSDRKQ